jgi:hypothetical protein
LYDLANLITISPEIIKVIIKYWWNSEAKIELDENLRKQSKYNGLCLRIDHTYKAVSTLGGKSNDNIWVKFIL